MGCPGYQGHCAKAPKQIKLKQVKGGRAGVKEGWVGQGRVGGGVLVLGVPGSVAQGGSEAEGWTASPEIHSASLKSVTLLSACLQRGTVCLVPTE